MKKINIFYWIFTGLFSLAMLSSGIPNMMASKEWTELFVHLGYPAYLLPLLGAAKVAGAIVILIPGFVRLKEWAYAGLFFDLVGATYSIIMVEGFQPQVSGMLVFFGLFALSYVYHHKRLRALTDATVSTRTSAIAG
jgi:uncharacterized membrane protein YphA (DoxX/SURF4 family)